MNYEISLMLHYQQKIQIIQ